MIAIREATSADIDALIQLESALFVEDAGTHDPHSDTTWPQREGRKDFEQLLGSADAILLVAESDGQPVGFLAGYSTPSSPTRLPMEYAILRSLYVAEDSRRFGVAGILSERFVDWARDRGCAEAHVDHYAANQGAGQLYEGLGFKQRSVSRTLNL